MKIIVYHTTFGCETGCCGHAVEVEEGEKPPVVGGNSFEFCHAADEEDKIEFARRLVRQRYGEEHVKDLDWENCRVVSYEDDAC